MSDTSNLTLLGSADTRYPSEYAPQILERFANRFPDHPYEVELECPEFTSLCPKTGQPDFARILIRYSPDAFLVESKSLKIYLFSYRNKGEFHEDCVNTIARDLFNLMQPRWIEVRGDFLPRGGISINPTVKLEKRYE
jgi:7-cyano-7-deazaguanine reductase